MSNRDRVGRGFEILAAGLTGFVDVRMQATVPGGDWLAELAKKEKARPGGKQYSRTDSHLLLRVLDMEWQVFRGELKPAARSYVTELRDARNKWAHGDAFSHDDAYRALDTMERLLEAVAAGDQAAKVRELRMEHQRAAYEAETRRAVRAIAATPAIDGLGLVGWRDVITPHRDVASGNFSASEFAADLHMVSRGTGSEEYVEPVQFFRRTYLTEGLRDLLSRAVRRIGGDPNASPVVNLQTNFGGGKTHSMLALYHLFSGRPLVDYPQEVQELLAGHDLGALGNRVKRATLVGNHLQPGSPAIRGRTEVRTLWGELAWQLGGREGYDIVADADRTSTNPGAALRELISAYAPCLILIDEWVAYARQLYGRDDLPAGTFDTQFTFAQTLTEAVKSVPGALLVVSIPASQDSTGDRPDVVSDQEVGGLNGREALLRLQNVVRRIADPWRPASAVESFEIVRRRLFEEPGGRARADIAAIARSFVRFYREHPGEFPSRCAEPAYEDRIKAAYPIHPELFDRLYEDWSTLERFQRTRGVLRLMSAVVHALWVNGDAAPLIMPGSVPLEAPLVLTELAQYLEDSWKPIVDADVAGTASTPAEIDGSRPVFGQRSLTRRIARTVFLGSAATLKSAHKGIERQGVWLGVAVPGDTVGNFGSALDLLADRATYLYVDGARYWYDTQASVSRTAKDFAEGLHVEDAWAEIVRRLRAEQAGRDPRVDLAGVHVAPETTGDVPDAEEARLVLVHPRHPHARGDTGSAAMGFARSLLETRGSAQRTNRNTVVALAPDAKRLEELVAGVREYLAWANIGERMEELNLSPQQQGQVRSRRRQADLAVAERIKAAYVWALVPVQHDPARPATWEVVKADGAEGRLAVRTAAKLRQSDLLRTVHDSRVIRQDLDQKLRTVWERGHVSVGELWGYHLRYPYLARLRDRSVLDRGVASVQEKIAWEAEGFALATGYDEATGRYAGLTVPHEDPELGQITDTTLLVHPRLAREQRDRERAAAPPPLGGGGTAGGTGGGTEGETGGETTGPGGTTGPGPHPGAGREPVRNTRFFGVYRVNPERYGRDLARLSQEILQHLAADPGTQLEVTVEIHARRADGFPPDKVRTVTENAAVLKLDQHRFEDE